MDNFEDIQLLLDSWLEIIKTNAKDSRKNASKMKQGLEGRIIIKDNERIIFDYPSDKRQMETQEQLCYFRPDLTALITSDPQIEDGEWKVEDYLELCYNHYLIVIEKLRRIINAEEVRDLP